MLTVISFPIGTPLLNVTGVANAWLAIWNVSVLVMPHTSVIPLGKRYNLNILELNKIEKPLKSCDLRGFDCL